MHQKPTLGAVQSQDGGYGFVVHGDHSKPVVSFGYSTRKEAEDAHAHMAAVLASCKGAMGYA